MGFINLILENISWIFAILFSFILLVIIFFYSKERISKKESLIVMALNLSFPYFLTYNKTYYTNEFKGILYIMLATFVFFIFFKILTKKPYHLIWVILLPMALALMVRLRSVFLPLVIFLLVYLNYFWIKNKKIRDLSLFNPIFVLFIFIFFYTSQINYFFYFSLDKFSVFDFRGFIENLFLFPRSNVLFILLVFWILFINIALLQGTKDKDRKRELFLIIIPEIIFFLIYLFLFSGSNISYAGIYLGIMPFIPLNIFYFYIFIREFPLKYRNAILVLFIICGISGNFFLYL